MTRQYIKSGAHVKEYNELAIHYNRIGYAGHTTRGKGLCGRYGRTSKEGHLLTCGHCINLYYKHGPDGPPSTHGSKDDKIPASFYTAPAYKVTIYDGPSLVSSSILSFEVPASKRAITTAIRKQGNITGIKTRIRFNADNNEISYRPFNTSYIVRATPIAG